MVLSWQDVYNLTLRLSEKIVDSGFSPTVIVGIARGGWIPARILSDVLYANTMWNVRIEYYTDLGRKGREPKITQPLMVPLVGQKVLVVDEVADSGESLRYAVDHVKKQQVSEVKSAVLHLKRHSSMIPDYYMQMVEAWTIYPWELRESIIALVKKFKADDPTLDPKKIRDRLVFEVGFEPAVADYFLKRL